MTRYSKPSARQSRQNNRLPGEPFSQPPRRNLRQASVPMMLALVATFSLTILVAGFTAGLWPVPARVRRAFATSVIAEGQGAFACQSPTHHDGDAIRCEGSKRSMRLYAMDAPEMPGACRIGRQCTPGDPYASRDHLASLTVGKSVTCRQLDTDHYGRLIVQCFAASVDLSCKMERDGFAVERYGKLPC